MITTNINLDVSKTGVQSTVYVSQGDTDSRRIVISLTNFGHSVDIDDDCFAVLMGRIGSTEFNTQCEIKNNKIYFDIKSGHTLQSGTINANIRIQKQGKILYSPKFNIVVADTFNNEGTVIDTSGYTDFSSAITDMENLQKKNISSVVITDTEVDGVTAHKVDINFVDISMSPVTFTVKDGKQGLKGDKGDTGPQGTQGEKGDKGEQGVPGKDAYQFFKTISTGKDLSQFTDGVYLATSDIVITNKSATNKELLLYENTFFIVENIMLISKNKLTFYGNCVFDGENKPYSAYQISEVSGNLSDVSAYTSLLTEINNLRTDTENSLLLKQDKLTAGAGIKIDDNVISADTQFSLIKASGRSEVGYSYPVPDVDNPKSNAIYLVPIENPETDDDYHYEWLWDDSYQNGAWELLGTTSLSAIPKKISQLENDSNFVSEANLPIKNLTLTTTSYTMLSDISDGCYIINQSGVIKTNGGRVITLGVGTELMVNTYDGVKSLTYQTAKTLSMLNDTFIAGQKVYSWLNSGNKSAEINSNSTDETLPTSKAVYEVIKEKQNKFEIGSGLVLENGVLSLNIPTADSSTVYGGTV